MRKQTITEIWAERHSSLLGEFYVYCFWGAEAQLHRFLQRYSVEKTLLTARQQGHTAIESLLSDGSIRVEIAVGASPGQ